MKPVILDGCCKAGGAGMGYHHAGFEVVGVDKDPQPNYPFEFIQDDILSFLDKRGKEFNAIHVSPPCQAFSKAASNARLQGKIYDDIITECRILIEKTGLPGIIENVPQAPIRPDVVLKGHVFGLKVLRKRHFELLNWFMLNPCMDKEKGTVVNGDYVSVFGSGSWLTASQKTKHKAKVPAWKKTTVRDTWAYAMGINWHMNLKELANAIPPAYTKYIGEHLIEYLKK